MIEIPLVSICCITYNQDKYIRKCLDGFLMQKTNFAFEIIIHDDASSDSTQNIINEYVKKRNDIFIPILQTENQYSKGNRAILATFCYPIVRGKYIAICEGDDYWTDPYKLQKQVDFLESHPDYSMCVTNYDVLRCDTGELESWISNEEKDLSMEELIMDAWKYCATASMFFRLDALKTRPDELDSLYVGDYPLCIYMRSVGKVRLLGRDHSCVYRYMSFGSWTAKNVNEKKSLHDIKRSIENERHMLRVLDEITDRKWHSSFRKRWLFHSFIQYVRNYPTKAAWIFWKDPLFFYDLYPLRLLFGINGPRQLKRMIIKLLGM